MIEFNALWSWLLDVASDGLWAQAT